MSLEIAEPKLITDLLEMWENEAQETESSEESRKRIAQKMAAAIKKFVMAGIVNTTGTATAQIGKIT